MDRAQKWIGLSGAGSTNFSEPPVVDVHVPVTIGLSLVYGTGSGHFQILTTARAQRLDLHCIRQRTPPEANRRASETGPPSTAGKQMGDCHLDYETGVGG